MIAKIERFDHQGNGIAYINEVITFVPKTLPGDIVEIEITKSKKNYNQAKLIKIVEPSEKRIKAFCPYYDLCGGCDLQNLAYEDTIEYKKDKIKNIFQRINLNVDPIVIPNDNPTYYRNKIELKVKDGKIGFYQAGTNIIVDIDKCMITRQCINEVIPFIKTWNIKNGEITLRCNQNNEILIIIESKDDINIDIDALREKNKLVGIVLNRNTIYGENYLFERINGILFKISYDSFFQVNPTVAAKLFEIVGENIGEGEKVLDLYTGVGTLALTAAKKENEVVGIEIVPNAVINAINNARINKLDKVSFVLNDVSDAIEKIDPEFDLWMIDPPRIGIDKNTINVIKKHLPKRLVYVSCDAQTLVRDIDLLKDDYNLEKLYILDMFSYTYHVECVCVLNRDRSL